MRNRRPRRHLPARAAAADDRGRFGSAGRSVGRQSAELGRGAAAAADLLGDVGDQVFGVIGLGQVVVDAQGGQGASRGRGGSPALQIIIRWSGRARLIRRQTSTPEKTGRFRSSRTRSNGPESANRSTPSGPSPASTT